MHLLNVVLNLFKVKNKDPIDVFLMDFFVNLRYMKLFNIHNINLVFLFLTLNIYFLLRYYGTFITDIFLVRQIFYKSFDPLNSGKIKTKHQLTLIPARHSHLIQLHLYQLTKSNWKSMESLSYRRQIPTSFRVQLKNILHIRGFSHKNERNQIQSFSSILKTSSSRFLLHLDIKTELTKKHWPIDMKFTNSVSLHSVNHPRDF